MLKTIAGRSNLVNNRNANDKKTDKEEQVKTKSKYPSFVRNFYNYFSEYSDNTSIHGIKYIGEQKRTIIEKLWWVIVFSASLYFCISMIMKTYHKWQTSPVIVSFAQTSTPVWKIPFPAVTICSETKTKQRIFNFTHMYRKSIYGSITTAEDNLLEKISLVCESHLHPSGNETIDYDTIDFLEKVAPSFDEVFYECRWMNKIKDCAKMFTPMLSEEGICFTFNMLDREELFTNTVFQNREYLHHGVKSTNWTLEGGYPKYTTSNDFPKRAISAGQGAGLYVLLRAYTPDLDYICRGPVQGFKVLLHHPAETPRVSQQYFRAPLDQEIVVAIKPDIMTTSEGLKGYDPNKRQCYFGSERQLRFYQVYTQQNCEVECLTNYTYKECNCVSYHMPHDEYTPLCGAGRTKCVNDALISLLSSEVEKNLESYQEEDEAKQTKPGRESCNCLPACTSLAYNSENSQADFQWLKVFQSNKTSLKGLADAKMTGVSLFFKQMQFITSERNELYGPTDFLANCGGLLGLFMGFSFLSVIEILYFLSLRLICNIIKYGRHFWSGSAELLQNYGYHQKQ